MQEIRVYFSGPTLLVLVEISLDRGHPPPLKIHPARDAVSGPHQDGHFMRKHCYRLLKYASAMDKERQRLLKIKILVVPSFATRCMLVQLWSQCCCLTFAISIHIPKIGTHKALCVPMWRTHAWVSAFNTEEMTAVQKALLLNCELCHQPAVQPLDLRFLYNLCWQVRYEIVLETHCFSRLWGWHSHGQPQIGQMLPLKVTPLSVMLHEPPSLLVLPKCDHTVHWDCKPGMF